MLKKPKVTLIILSRKFLNKNNEMEDAKGLS